MAIVLIVLANAVGAVAGLVAEALHRSTDIPVFFLTWGAVLGAYLFEYWLASVSIPEDDR